MDLDNIGKVIIIFGGILLISGILMVLLSKYFTITKLPGDIYIKRDGFSLYIPVMVTILLSIGLTLILNLIFRLK